MSSSATADVTCVKASERHSKFPNEPAESNRDTSASVAQEGNVNRRGPPFLCYKKNIVLINGFNLHC